MARLIRQPDENIIIHDLMEIFPEACPNYLRDICRGKNKTPQVLNKLISEILNEDYPKRQRSTSSKEEIDFREQLDVLKQILPDADPSYLENQYMKLLDKPDELNKLSLALLETHTYPTKKDYLKKQEISSQIKFYTTNFNISKFLKIIPDPISYFGDPSRKTSNLSEENCQYGRWVLANQFPNIPMYVIRITFEKQDYNLFTTYQQLQNVKPNLYLIIPRKPYFVSINVIENIPFLQEIAFIQHFKEIVAAVQERKINEAKERRRAKAAGILQTCTCCFDEEVMPTHIYECENGCIFCKDCIRKGAEIAFGDGKLEFPCLNACSSYFSLQTLQVVLNPKMFSKVVQKKQLEEIKIAGIEGLEICPFCDFATIPQAEDKLFHCLNSECMKETCRLCKEPAHLPLRCEEVEKKEDVDLRTYVENKMTEALLRKCYKCGISFIKADGCNKMTCSCGAIMCYLCGEPVTNYKHFNGLGGDKLERCPLYSDTHKLHEEAVLRGAQTAKKEKGLDLNPSKLKIDPTLDVQQHYEEVSKKNPVNIPLLGIPFGVNIARILVGHRPEQFEQFYRHLQNRQQ